MVPEQATRPGPRFACGKRMKTHVALQKQMLPRSEYPPECLLPIPHGLPIYHYNDMLDNRRPYPFLGEGIVNVGRIAAVEFKNGPHCGTHLLALFEKRHFRELPCLKARQLKLRFIPTHGNDSSGRLTRPCRPPGWRGIVCTGIIAHYGRGWKSAPRRMSSPSRGRNMSGVPGASGR